ncbi:ATP-binding protein [bacterium]|nr:ATP-binding protein [bacterium]
MVQRALQISQEDSLMLFGARGTGKSTLLKQLFPPGPNLWIDLLKPSVEARFSRDPEELERIVQAQPKLERVVIDEIQKCPRLLDVVHGLIESTDVKFVMTGSSARKLRKGAANLLAGRAFEYHLHALTQIELMAEFRLEDALHWGTLPRILSLNSDSRKRSFLQTYSLTYVKEEVWAEHLIRQLEPFRRFLEVAAQADGKIVNFSKIALDVGVDGKTVQSYFEILVETHLGFWLEAYHSSIRKQIRLAPKFLFFDIGVSRALSRTLTLPVQEGTSAFGERFEQWVLLECFRLNDYLCCDYRFSYLHTKNGVEIDLIVERPGKRLLLIEIKSTVCVRADHLRHLEAIGHDLPDAEAWCMSRDPVPKKTGNVQVYPWQEGLQKLFPLDNDAPVHAGLS